MYKFKTSEQNNDKATEFETKSLLYLLTKTSLDKGTQRKTTENELPSLTQCTA